MKKQFLSFLFLLSLVVSVSAQEQASRKISEMPSLWYCDPLIMTLDTFLLELQNNPQSNGFIFYYEGKYDNGEEKSKRKMLLPRRGEADFRMQIIRNHIKLRRQNPDRIFFINGGFRDEQKTEFWIVPEGSKLPIPEPTLEALKYRKGKPKWRCDI